MLDSLARAHCNLTAFLTDTHTLQVPGIMHLHGAVSEDADASVNGKSGAFRDAQPLSKVKPVVCGCGRRPGIGVHPDVLNVSDRTNQRSDALAPSFFQESAKGPHRGG